jgi:DnaK suppressor protein
MNKHEVLLRKRKEDLLSSLEGIKESAKPVDLNDPIGRLSRMDAIQQQQMALNAKKQIEINLELLEQALQRLARDEYGVCLSCEENIEEKRLEARPEAPFCTKCQR